VKQPAIRRPPLVHVLWTDAFSARGWRNHDEIQELIRESTDIDSVGYLIHRSPKKVVLVGSIDRQETPNMNHYHEIPTSMVKRITHLRVKT
jgi:hypothetical protein